MDKNFIKQNMMGPNAITLLNELIEGYDFNSSMKILDLGCGCGLTSITLAEKTQAQIIAADLWVSATDNYRRFKDYANIIPLHIDITKPNPFAEEYFDVIVSVDSYCYYGMNPNFLDATIAPLLKKGGKIMICTPGFKEDIHDNLPPELLLSWTAQDLADFHSVNWWSDLFAKSEKMALIDIHEMNAFEQPWNDWLATDNPYAIQDRASMNVGAGKYMNFIAAVLQRK